MKPSTFQCISMERLVSNGDTVTATIPKGCSAIQLTVEQNPCRMTLTADGDPTTSVGHVVPKDQMPWLMLVGQGCVIRFAATVGSSVIQISYLQ